MEIYSHKDKPIQLEDKDFLLITAIDNLTEAINKARMAYG